MMKTLEMSNFGVLEMQQEEMIRVDGGDATTSALWGYGVALFAIGASPVIGPVLAVTAIVGTVAACAKVYQNSH